MENRRIGFLLKMITEKMKTGADADFKRYNLTFTQSKVLAYLDSCSGQATQKELEDYLCVSHPTTVGVVTRMERSGYVRSWFDPQDKRNKIIALTDKAAVCVKEMESVIVQKEKEMLSGLSDDQIDELEKMLLTIYKNVT